MEEKDVAPSPDWRPRSSLSEGLQSSATSSSIHSGTRPNSESFTTHLNENDNDEGVSIYPFETTICPQLTKAISTTDNLQSVLRKAAETIQRNAKWFTEAGLEELIGQVILQASDSTSTADLYVALDLMDIIMTFSILPKANLTQLASFISLAYYHGTRMHKHKGLAKKAWTVFKHILQSHLGFLGTLSLLELLSKEEPLWSRASFAAVSGALRLIEEKLPIGAPTETSAPLVPVFELLDALQTVVTEGDDILKEQVIAVLDKIISDSSAVVELDRSACWDKFVTLMLQCKISSSFPPGRHLLQIVSERSHSLDPSVLRELPTVFITAQVQLPDAVTDQILAPLKASRRLTGPNPSEHNELLKTFSRNKQHHKELQALIQNDLEVLVCSNDRRDWDQLVQRYMSVTSSDETDVEAAISCTAFLCSLLHSAFGQAESNTQMWKVTRVFDGVTKLAVSAIKPEARLCALRMLSRLRATISGNVYIAEDEAAEGSVAASTSPGRLIASNLPRRLWLDEVVALIRNPEIPQNQLCASFVTAALPDQLSNLALFNDQSEYIKTIYKVSVRKLAMPNSSTAASYVRILTALISYRWLFTPAEERQLVDLFIRTAGSSETVSKDCIHSLTICCHEMPATVARELDNILQKMAQMITQKHLAIHVLEFLTGLSRLPNLFRDFRPDDYRKIFGVCISYLQSLRQGQPGRQFSTADNSSSSNTGTHEIIPQYVYALAHNVIVFWYITLRPDDRQAIKTYVTNNLTYLKDDGREVPDDQGLVVIDFMERNDTASATNLESIAHRNVDGDELFDTVDGRIMIQHRICGMVLISTHTSLRNAKTWVITRRPSGTTRFVVYGRASSVERDSWTSAGVSAAQSSIFSGSTGEDETLTIYSDDHDGSVYGTIPVPNSSSPLGSSEVIILTEDPALDRAIQMFDRTPGLDSHKAGVLYIGQGQTNEQEILSNSSGSPDYRDIVHKLGTLERLKGAKFNPQGLDTRDNADGEHAIMWDNGITELVFHVTTMMPTDAENPQASAMRKKAHVGNDFVNIVFNNSGLPFAFDILPSAFNYVYIVITPSVQTTFLQTRTHTMKTDASKRFYKVEVVTRDEFPAISSAAEPKMISGESLPGYVRNLALNACVFSDVWVNRDGEEYKSSWRNRLDQIRRLKERYAPAQSMDPIAGRAGMGAKGKGKLAFWKRQKDIPDLVGMG